MDMAQDTGPRVSCAELPRRNEKEKSIQQSCLNTRRASWFSTCVLSALCRKRSSSSSVDVSLPHLYSDICSNLIASQVSYVNMFTALYTFMEFIAPSL